MPSPEDNPRAETANLEIELARALDGVPLEAGDSKDRAEVGQPSSCVALRRVVCGCACDRATWRRVACGQGAWKTWTGCVCCSFWLLITILLAAYLPTFLYLNNSLYTCPAEPPPPIEPSVPPSGNYTLAKEYAGPGFLDGWDFFSADDPTEGTVNYVTREEAAERNLTYYDAAAGLWYLKSAAGEAAQPGGRGRDSVRLHSRDTFMYGVFVAEVVHIPAGCGTWPAWWLTNDPWPSHGEIDIIEQIHGVGQNNFVGHTEGGCDVPAPEDSFLGTWKPSYPWLTRPSTDCTHANNVQGCAADLPPGTFGSPFNAGGGGAYALVWDDAGARMYFWSAACGGLPPDVAAGRPEPASWGLPMARFDFSAADCPPARFFDLYMVINLTFCGTWAGSFSWLQCAFAHGPSCDAYVRSDPREFGEAYWAIRSVRVYQQAEG
eukprot:jgi/Tetstr1/423664/TSEL_014299.t2